MSFRSSVIVVLGWGAITTWAETSAAQEARREQCLSAFDAAQRQEKAGALLESASRFAFCADSVCPELVSNECKAGLERVHLRTPSIRPTWEGDPVPGKARVSIDGQPRDWGERGEIFLNPGRHEMKVEADGFEPSISQILVGEGDRQVPVSIRLNQLATRSKSEPSPHAVRHAPTTSVRFPTVSLALGGVSLVGFGGFIAFGLLARAGERELQGCAPYCSQSRIDGVRREYWVANTGLALGVVAATAAGVTLLLTRPLGKSRAGLARGGVSIAIGTGVTISGSL